MCMRVPVCVDMCEYVCVHMCMSVLVVGSIGGMRCAIKKNDPLSILRACLRLCVHGGVEEKIESTGVDVGG